MAARSQTVDCPHCTELDAEYPDIPEYIWQHIEDMHTALHANSGTLGATPITPVRRGIFEIDLADFSDTR